MPIASPSHHTDQSRLKALHEVVLTVEDHARMGGFGSACAEAILERRPDLAPRLRILGVPDAFVDHGATMITKPASRKASTHSSFGPLDGVSGAPREP